MKKSILLLTLILGLAVSASQAVAAPTIAAAQKITRSGMTPTAAVYSGSGAGLVDVTNGNKIYLLTDGVFLRFTNPGATNLTITVQDQFTNQQGYTNNLSGVCVAASTVYLGPFLKSRWADGAGYLQVSYAGSTVTAMEVMRLPIGEQDAFTK